MKIVVDTNIILDFFLSREPYVSDARKLFSLICQEKADAYITANSITDVYYVTSKKLNETAAREAIKHLLKMIDVISVDGEDCTEALSLPIGDFEDALVVVCADKKSIDYIITNDKEFLQSATADIAVISLSDFHALNTFPTTNFDPLK